MSKPEKLVIACVDSPKIEVTAHFNPKEFSIDKSVPWSKHSNPEGDIPMLEFTSGENRTLSLELLFNGYETGKSVQPDVEKLHKMTLSHDYGGDRGKHPPFVVVTWGREDFPNFKGVIESLGTKYTMFLSDGTPVRATCTVKIKEISQEQIKKG